MKMWIQNNAASEASRKIFGLCPQLWHSGSTLVANEVKEIFEMNLFGGKTAVGGGRNCPVLCPPCPFLATSLVRGELLTMGRYTDLCNLLTEYWTDYTFWLGKLSSLSLNAKCVFVRLKVLTRRLLVKIFNYKVLKVTNRNSFSHFSVNMRSCTVGDEE